MFVTPQQQNWVDVQKLLLRTGMTSRPARFEEPAWRAGLYDFVMGSVFEEFILITIVVNVLFMAMVHADMSPQWQVRSGWEGRRVQPFWAGVAGC